MKIAINFNGRYPSFYVGTAVLTLPMNTGRVKSNTTLICDC